MCFLLVLQLALAMSSVLVNKHLLNGIINNNNNNNNNNNYYYYYYIVLCFDFCLWVRVCYICILVLILFQAITLSSRQIFKKIKI